VSECDLGNASGGSCFGASEDAGYWPALEATARTISAEFAVPADTIRGWVRRATGRAGWLYAQGITAGHSLDPMLPAAVPRRSALAEALDALAAAAAAAVRRLGPLGSPWQIIADDRARPAPRPLGSD
jgi:hypothetical protein